MKKFDEVIREDGELTKEDDEFIREDGELAKEDDELIREDGELTKEDDDTVKDLAIMLSSSLFVDTCFLLQANQLWNSL